MKRYLLCFALVIVLAAVFVSFATPVHATGDFEIVDGVLIRYSGPGGHVVIPEGVTEIGRDVFLGNADVTSVSFPSTLAVIGRGAFFNALNLREVNLPQSVTIIRESAFAFCWALETVVIPHTIQIIERNAFQSTRWQDVNFAAYDWVGVYSHGAFLVRSGEFYGLASLSGASIWPTQYDAIQALRNGYREIKRNGTWSIVDSSFKPTNNIDNRLRVMTANPEDYILESQHFIIHKEPTRHLVGQISPAAFALWLEDLDTLYQIYYEFIGTAPANGAKINVRVLYDIDVYTYGFNPIGGAWGSTWGNNIWLRSTLVYTRPSTLGAIMAHELGHNFHHPSWTFNVEFVANLFVLHAMHINNTYQVLSDTFFCSQYLYLAHRRYLEALEAFNAGTLHDFSHCGGYCDLNLYFGPIIRYAGWDVISATLHSYFNNSFPLQNHMYTGERNSVILADLIDRITYFNDGICVLSFSVDNGALLRQAYPVQKVPRTAITHNDFASNGLVEFFAVPDFITHVDNHTFMDFRALQTIVVHEDVGYIGDRAFLGCESLRHVYIFSRDVQIHHWAFFSGWDVDFNIYDNITLYGFAGSTVEAFARNHQINFVPLAETASPASTIFVNGRRWAFEAYNIGGNNFFRLRDIAFALNGTNQQFSVDWDTARNAISITTGNPYTVVGGEMTGIRAAVASPSSTTARIYIDDRAVQLTAYNINGNNFFRLRDIAQALNFSLQWDAATGIMLDTSLPHGS